MQENKRRLVGQAQVAAESWRALALDFASEHRDGRQIAAQGQFVAGEQRPAGDGEFLFAALAAETERTVRTAGFVSLYAAGGAYRRAVGIGPADSFEGCLGFRVSHAEH
jgi:hypothetical protein